MCSLKKNYSIEVEVELPINNGAMNNVVTGQLAKYSNGLFMHSEVSAYNSF